MLALGCVLDLASCSFIRILPIKPSSDDVVHKDTVNSGWMKWGGTKRRDSPPRRGERGGKQKDPKEDCLKLLRGVDAQG